MKTLRDYMRRERISQVEMARRLGVSQGLVSLYLSGKRQIGKRVAPAVAALLGLNVADVLYPAKKKAR